jgi:hypothetical protein
VPSETVRTGAQRALGAIRLFNGAVALLAPSTTAGRLGVDPDANQAPFYPLRMFGVRTVVLGLELLRGDEETRSRSARTGIAIHASDTLAAGIGGLRGQLPRRTALILVGVSSLNTALAVTGSAGRRPKAWWQAPLRR